MTILRSERTTILLTVLIALALIGLAFFVRERGVECPHQPYITLEGERISVLLATTSQAQEKGLSGHAPLGEGEGMLFEFNDKSMRAFWMKDMLFPLDIIWLDEGLRVLGVVHNARPESYPEIFPSSASMRYALEVSAGVATRYNIATGSTAVFSLCEN